MPWILGSANLFIDIQLLCKQLILDSKYIVKLINSLQNYTFNPYLHNILKRIKITNCSTYMQVLLYVLPVFKDII